MNDARIPNSRPGFVRRRRLVLGAGFLLAGCAEPYRRAEAPSPIASLEVQGSVEVAQGGRVQAGYAGMPLYAGDTIRTGASSYALCRFEDGNRVWLDYDTRVRLGSVFAFFGRVFAAVSGIFEIDSEFVAASSEGTEYTVSIGRRAPDFSVAVKSGAVLCRARRSRWRPVRLVAGQRLAGTGIETPSADRLDPGEYEAEFGWVPAQAQIPPPEFRGPARRREAPPARSPNPPGATEPMTPTPTRPPGSSAPGSTPPAQPVPRSGGSILQRPVPPSSRDPR